MVPVIVLCKGITLLMYVDLFDFVLHAKIRTIRIFFANLSFTWIYSGYYHIQLFYRL